MSDLHPWPGAPAAHAAFPIAQLRAGAWRVPTDLPEADGTLHWSQTTLVLAEVEAGGITGIGYTYTDAAAAAVIRNALGPALIGQDALDIPGCWLGMARHIRNDGRPGLVGNALSAVDAALWDLKGKLLNVPVATLLGRVRDSVPVYGSGGFTSYNSDQLQRQLRHWAESGIRAVKMKVGERPDEDVQRARTARSAIGHEVALMVDANGAYSRKQALRLASAFADLGVVWFEEPVSSNDREGLRLMRNRAPAGMDITTGEYGYDLSYFRTLIQDETVDVLQADATRCGGLSEFLRVGALCEAYELPMSSHTAPSLHLHACCSLKALRHMEWFHDHVRLEHLLFDGAPKPLDGCVAPDLSRPGLGIEFKAADAARYAA